MVLCPDVAPCIYSRFDCCDLLQRNVIHFRAERKASSAIISISHSGRNDRNGMLRVYFAALPKIEAPACLLSDFRPELLYWRRPAERLRRPAPKAVLLVGRPQEFTQSSGRSTC